MWKNKLKILCHDSHAIVEGKNGYEAKNNIFFGHKQRYWKQSNIKIRNRKGSENTCEAKMMGIKNGKISHSFKGKDVRSFLIFCSTRIIQKISVRYFSFSDTGFMHLLFREKVNVYLFQNVTQLRRSHYRLEKCIGLPPRSHGFNPLLA